MPHLSFYGDRTFDSDSNGTHFCQNMEIEHYQIIVFNRRLVYSIAISTIRSVMVQLPLFLQYVTICLFHSYQYHKICYGAIASTSSISETRLDKTNKMSVRPAKTQLSLCAQWVAKDQSFLHADSEDSDQTGRLCCHSN